MDTLVCIWHTLTYTQECLRFVWLFLFYPSRLLWLLLWSWIWCVARVFTCCSIRTHSLSSSFTAAVAVLPLARSFAVATPLLFFFSMFYVQSTAFVFDNISNQYMLSVSDIHAYPTIYTAYSTQTHFNVLGWFMRVWSVNGSVNVWEIVHSHSCSNRFVLCLSFNVLWVEVPCRGSLSFHLSLSLCMRFGVVSFTSIHLFYILVQLLILDACILPTCICRLCSVAII